MERRQLWEMAPRETGHGGRWQKARARPSLRGGQVSASGLTKALTGLSPGDVESCLPESGSLLESPRGAHEPGRKGKGTQIPVSRRNEN